MQLGGAVTVPHIEPGSSGVKDPGVQVHAEDA